MRIMMQPAATSGGGGEAEFLGAEKGGDRHVAPGLHLSVGLDDDPAAQSVDHQRLLRFRQSHFPRRARMLDARSSGLAPVPPS